MIKCSRSLFIVLVSSGALVVSLSAGAQDNSPYSRYGLGDVIPSTNIVTRGMGSISAGFADRYSINFNNPASYSQFEAIKDPRSKKLSAGRALFDVGLNFDNRTIIAPNTANRFTSSDAIFSYLQVGMPLKKNWGLSFGLRPMSRISYAINRREVLKDPNTGNNIDSAITQFKGSGGSYLPTIGTGFGFYVSHNKDRAAAPTHFLSLGANGGYLFGNRENTTLRSLINDTVSYYASDNHTTTSFGNLFFNYGIQYSIEHYNAAKKMGTVIRFGFSGNTAQNIRAQQDLLRQTYTLGTAGEELQIDSVFQQEGVKGTIRYPASYKFGFVAERSGSNGGWAFGADFSKAKWSQYRYFNLADSTQDTWAINAGAQFFPKQKSNYFSRLTYRIGGYAGRDYVQVKGNLPVFGISAGVGLPIYPRSQLVRNQFSMLNLSFEYGKRGNDDNVLKENMFRISAGFSFSDLWFGKRKYE